MLGQSQFYNHCVCNHKQLGAGASCAFNTAEVDSEEVVSSIAVQETANSCSIDKEPILHLAVTSSEYVKETEKGMYKDLSHTSIIVHIIMCLAYRDLIGYCS